MLIPLNVRVVDLFLRGTDGPIASFELRDLKGTRITIVVAGKRTVTSRRLQTDQIKRA